MQEEVIPNNVILLEEGELQQQPRFASDYEEHEYVMNDEFDLDDMNDNVRLYNSACSLF